VLLCGDDDQRAAVELAGGLGAVDELPQPSQRCLRVAVVAVVDPQPATGAVLAGLGDVGAQLVDDQSDAARGDPGDPLPALGVRRAVVVGPEQRVDEEPRDVDVARVNGGQAVHEGVAEVEVGAVRLVGQLAQLRVALALGDLHRVRLGLAAVGGLLLLGDGRDLRVQLVVGAPDGALDEFAVERAVDDDRPAAIELDQHRGGASLVDVGVGEPDRRQAVSVAVQLPVQLLRLAVELLSLLAQPQLADIVRARRVQVGGEHPAVAGIGQGGVEHPARLANEALRGSGVAIVEVGDHGTQQVGRDGADRTQLVDGSQGDDALAD
jgi:hypothetical protein